MRYITEIREISLLGAEEEVWLSEAKNHPDATEDEKELAIMMLIKHNLRLVVSTANKFGTDNDFEDIVFDGNQGLVEAAKRFDHTKGHQGKGRFTTYAMHWILKFIRDGFRRRSYKVVSIPKNTELNSRKIGNSVRINDQSEISDIMEELGIPESHAIEAKAVESITICPIGEWDDGGYDVIDETSPSSYESTAKSDLLALVYRVFKELNLTEDERRLASMDRESSNGFPTELAKKLGVGRSAVHMMRKKIVWKVRRRLLNILGKEEFKSLSDKIIPDKWKKPTLDGGKRSKRGRTRKPSRR